MTIKILYGRSKMDNLFAYLGALGSIDSLLNKNGQLTDIWGESDSGCIFKKNDTVTAEKLAATVLDKFNFADFNMVLPEVDKLKNRMLDLIRNKEKEWHQNIDTLFAHQFSEEKELSFKKDIVKFILPDFYEITENTDNIFDLDPNVEEKYDCYIQLIHYCENPNEDHNIEYFINQIIKEDLELSEELIPESEYKIDNDNTIAFIDNNSITILQNLYAYIHTPLTFENCEELKNLLKQFVSVKINIYYRQAYDSFYNPYSNKYQKILPFDEISEPCLSVLDLKVYFNTITKLLNNDVKCQKEFDNMFRQMQHYLNIQDKFNKSVKEALRDDLTFLMITSWEYTNSLYQLKIRNESYNKKTAYIMAFNNNPKEKKFYLKKYISYSGDKIVKANQDRQNFILNMSDSSDKKVLNDLLNRNEQKNILGRKSPLYEYKTAKTVLPHFIRRNYDGKTNEREVLMHSLYDIGTILGLIGVSTTLKNPYLYPINLPDIDLIDDIKKRYNGKFEGFELPGNNSESNATTETSKDKTGLSLKQRLPKHQQYLAHVLGKKLRNEWDVEKNKDIPKPKAGWLRSNEKVWWKCNFCGHEWQDSIVNRTVSGTGCPKCKKAYTNIADFLDAFHCVPIAAHDSQFSADNVIQKCKDMAENESNKRKQSSIDFLNTITQEKLAVIGQYMIERFVNGCLLSKAYQCKNQSPLQKYLKNCKRTPDQDDFQDFIGFYLDDVIDKLIILPLPRTRLFVLDYLEKYILEQTNLNTMKAKKEGWTPEYISHNFGMLTKSIRTIIKQWLEVTVPVHVLYFHYLATSYDLTIDSVEYYKVLYNNEKYHFYNYVTDTNNKLDINQAILSKYKMQSIHELSTEKNNFFNRYTKRFYNYFVEETLRINTFYSFDKQLDVFKLRHKNKTFCSLTTKDELSDALLFTGNLYLKFKDNNNEEHIYLAKTTD